jgi:hypothetical protein
MYRIRNINMSKYIQITILIVRKEGERKEGGKGGKEKKGGRRRPI